MDPTNAYTGAFLLAGVALPLISYGSMNGMESLATVGLVAIVVAGIIPLIVRYLEEPTPA